MSKRQRTREEKINDCLDNHICNLHPDLRNELFKILIESTHLNNSVARMKSFLAKELQLPEMGILTFPYWVARGWSIPEAKYKSKIIHKTKKHSPFSRQHWMEKINPETGKKYTEVEADFKRNSLRPIKKEYWLIRGNSEEKAILLANEQKEYNNNKGANGSLNRNKEETFATSYKRPEYWLMRGFSEEDAKEKISQSQVTFSKEKCIEKYGDEKGIEIWNKRQEKWLNTLNSKTKTEILEINSKKSSKINYKTLWTEELDDPCMLYILKIGDNVLKIGITTKELYKRYKHTSLKSCEVILTHKDTVNNCFILEQLIKMRYKEKVLSKNEQIGEFGYTESFKDISETEFTDTLHELMKTNYKEFFYEEIKSKKYKIHI